MKLATISRAHRDRPAHTRMGATLLTQLCHPSSIFILILLSFSLSMLVLLTISQAQDVSRAQDPLAASTLTRRDEESAQGSNDAGPSQPSSQQRQRIELRAARALELARDWALRFGREIHQGSQEATCHRAIRSQFDPAKSDRARRGPYRASVVSIDWTRMHADIVRTVSTTMGWHESAVGAIVEASESLAANHSYDENLPNVDYVDVHRLHDIDEMMTEEQDQELPPPEPSGNQDQEPFPPSSSSSLELPTPTYNGVDDETGRASNNEPSLSSSPADSQSQSSVVVSTLMGSATNEQDTFRLRKRSEPVSAAVAGSESPVNQMVTPQPLVMLQPAGTPMPQDEAQGEWQTPIKYAKLSRHPHFGELLINTEMSAVHVPVHIYPGNPVVKNSIAWSEGLTRVFKNNLVQNPRLTNQYFASPHGFMRLFPAQKWPIARTDPDLYDARMRPWYVAGASSRKDVIILVDASGSMTGSRRDIAKGVVFEILDTLTHNDHFLVLRFNDFVQQVGVPACSAMRTQRKLPKIPLKNTLLSPTLASSGGSGGSPSNGAESNGSNQQNNNNNENNNNGTDIESLYLLPATGRNVRHVKTNFTIPTSGIANFSHALVTAFEVLQKYQDSETLGSQCNQAIMLITDGSPSDFEEIFSRYNYPNAPVRVFTYLIGRETGDGTHTKMMACHNRGFYTHVINLAEVRETVQQYIPVMARPLVLNRTHPITWTPAYGELTYQMLTDWIWESRRRERARALLASHGIRASGEAGSGSEASTGGDQAYPSARAGGATIRVTNEDGLSAMDAAGSSGTGDDSYGDGLASGGSSLEAELDALDIFGYESNPDCFWETHRNDLTTTVVQPVYDQRNESKVVEKYLNKNTWIKKESRVRTANLLGVAAADMKINDIIGLAPSHKLGPNGYPVLLTNNGLVMHHPDLRSILEPLTNDPSERNSRILKPFFASLDLVELEHIVQQQEVEEATGSASSAVRQAEAASQSAASATTAANFLALRNEAVDGKTGWRELLTKRTLDCQRRVQTRTQSFYYKPLDQFPFVFIIAIPQPYGSYKLEAQVEVKSPDLPEKLTTYFTTSDYDLWSVHPDYRYCDGPSNNTITTLLDMFQRIEEGKLNDIEWHPAESSKPPIPLPGKIYCDKELVQSLVYDAVATYSFSEDCGPPSARDDESSLMRMFGVRFSFVATRSGLTRVRHHNSDDLVVKREALAFAKRHARAMDETYFKRTIDYNMLMNESATLIQVPFNTHQKILEQLGKFELDSQPGSGYEGAMGGGPKSDGVLSDEIAASASGTTSGVNGDGEPVDGEGSSQESTASGIGSGSGSSYGSKLSIKDMDLYEKLELLANSSSLHVIATESIIVNEGAQRAVAGVSGVFYDYATFVLRFLNSTNAKFSGTNEETRKRPAKCFLNGGGPTASGAATDDDQEACNEEWPPVIKCGYSNDTIDCLLIDNNGYILVSEQLEFIGRHLKAYDQAIMQRLVSNGVFREVNITDHQSICVKQEEKQTGAAGGSSSSSAAADSRVRVGYHLFAISSVGSMLANLLVSLIHTWTVFLTIGGFLIEICQAALLGIGSSGGASSAPGSVYQSSPQAAPLMLEIQQQQSFQALSALLPKKSYLRPCDRVLTRYETLPTSQRLGGGGSGAGASRPLGAERPEYYATKCNCPGWFVYEQVPMTNLIMLIVDSASIATCRGATKCNETNSGSGSRSMMTPLNGGIGVGGDLLEDDTLMSSSNIIGQNESQICSMFERDTKLHKRRLDSCISHHQDEEQIKLCGSASKPLGMIFTPISSFLWSFSLFLLSRLLMFNF
uniref:Voltage-dependent calcium channel subunit alpha-2/delta-3 n=2 Tax=Aceria tosichella TaxID=561515 RepID=A0A6G1SMK1_9ACAR